MWTVLPPGGTAHIAQDQEEQDQEEAMRMLSSVVSKLSGVMMAATLVMATSAVAVPAGTAGAAGGSSTPGALVMAVNPISPRAADGLGIVLNAHTERTDLAAMSCRPQDATARCWGALVLDMPLSGGLSVSSFEIHRVAVGDTDCGDDEDEGSCGGGHDEGGCEDDDEGCRGSEAPMAAASGPLHAVVSGVGVLRDPGSSGEPAGAKVQVKIQVTDNGGSSHTGVVDVQVNKFVEGPVKPELYRSGPQAVQLVRIQVRPDK